MASTSVGQPAPVRVPVRTGSGRGTGSWRYRLGSGDRFGWWHWFRSGHGLAWPRSRPGFLPFAPVYAVHRSSPVVASATTRPRRGSPFSVARLWRSRGLCLDTQVGDGALQEPNAPACRLVVGGVAGLRASETQGMGQRVGIVAGHAQQRERLAGQVELLAVIGHLVAVLPHALCDLQRRLTWGMCWPRIELFRGTSTTGPGTSVLTTCRRCGAGVLRRSGLGGDRTGWLDMAGIPTSPAGPVRGWDRRRTSVGTGRTAGAAAQGRRTSPRRPVRQQRALRRRPRGEVVGF